MLFSTFPVGEKVEWAYPISSYQLSSFCNVKVVDGLCGERREISKCLKEFYSSFIRPDGPICQLLSLVVHKAEVRAKTYLVYAK